MRGGKVDKKTKIKGRDSEGTMFKMIDEEKGWFLEWVRGHRGREDEVKVPRRVVNGNRNGKRRGGGRSCTGRRGRFGFGFGYYI